MKHVPRSINFRRFLFPVCTLLLSLGVAFGLQLASKLASASTSTSGSGSAVGIGYGVISVYNDIARTQDLGFNWIKLFLHWSSVQPTRTSALSWGGLDSLVNSAQAAGIEVLLRIDGTPSWARDPACNAPDQKNYPPNNVQELADFMYQVALHFRGRVAAYEIYNEPNLIDEWGGCNPDPIKYSNMLAALYSRVKQADPRAVVVTGGLSNTGDGTYPGRCNRDSPVCGDLMYLQNMYVLGGARPGTHYDAIGAHPYGGPNPPDTNPYSYPPTGLYFRRMDNMRDIMRDFGHNDPSPIWATEMGWLTDFDRGCNLDGGARLAQKVTLAHQGDYLKGAFEYAAANMPWIGAMFVFNLDWNRGYLADCDNGDMMRWFSIVDERGNGTSAYTKLKNMAKVDTMPPRSSMTQLPAYSQVSFSISWSGRDNNGGSGLSSYDVQKKVGDEGIWTDLLLGTTLTSTIVSGLDGQRLFFRARARDNRGNYEPHRDTDTFTTLDGLPPSSVVNPFPSTIVSRTSFIVAWTGSDSGSGILSYDIQVKEGETGTWIDWITSATAISATFSGRDRQTYFFRSRARDRVGNVETYPDRPDAQVTTSTSAALATSPALISSLVQKGTIAALGSLTLINGGGAATSWSAYASQPWLTITPSSGSLGAGVSTALQIQAAVPTGGTGTIAYTESLVITGTQAWNTPITVSLNIIAADQLRYLYIPLLYKGFQGGW